MKAFRALLVLLLAVSAWAQLPVPALKGRVTDLTGTLKPEQGATHEQLLRSFEARKGSQIAVLIVPTTAPETVEQYALRVGEQWKIGRKKVDDGAILVVAKDDRALRIEVGYGLEGALNDATASRIIREVIVPRFREGDFFGGISAGVDRMIRVIDGEPLPAPAKAAPPVGDGVLQMLPGCSSLPSSPGAILRQLLGQRRSLTGGVVAGSRGCSRARSRPSRRHRGVHLHADERRGGSGGTLLRRLWRRVLARVGGARPSGGGGFGGGGPRALVTVRLGRTLHHLFSMPGAVARALPAASLARVEQAIKKSETEHRGEIRFAVEAALESGALLSSQSSRSRALEVFSLLRVWDTEENNGVLIYLLLADRAAEIVVDRGIHAQVQAAEWRQICRRMEGAFAKGEFEHGVVSGIEEVSRVLARHFPPRPGDRNELSDEPAVL